MAGIGSQEPAHVSNGLDCKRGVGAVSGTSNETDWAGRAETLDAVLQQDIIHSTWHQSPVAPTTGADVKRLYGTRFAIERSERKVGAVRNETAELLWRWASS